VVIEHGNVCNYARAFCHEFGPVAGDVMLQNSVCTFDIFVEEVFPLLLAGGTLAIPSAATRDDFAALMRFATTTGVTIISGFPYLLAQINSEGGLPPTVRLLISGGDVLRAAYITNLQGRVAIYNTYGPSEATVCATYYDCSNAKPLSDGTFPVGRAVHGVPVEVLDAAGHQVAPGTVGEICIFGAGVGRGYMDATASEVLAFSCDAQGRRFYHSGDLGYLLPTGDLAFIKRKDRQVMIYGRRVEPQEVENVLGRLPQVQQAAVTVDYDDAGLARLNGAVVLLTGGKFNVETLRAQLRDYLPDYMIPAHIEVRETMPLLASGKIDRAAL
jgi:non-ribosomal peptide synthetase component F